MKIKLIKFKDVTSTNDIAIDLIKKKKIQPTLVLAEKQSKGRGTMGKKWISQKGNFFVSIFFELKKNMPEAKEFTFINPLIISKILKKYSKFEVKVKWPNDLLINSRKVCGILQELIQFNKKNFLIIGIGINTLTSPTSKKFKSISLSECSNKVINNQKILKKLKENYELSNWRHWKYKYKNL